ncbi:LOW QUALITY PROTEIN: hypothetical protein V1478_008553 [Vespula squamosa]|uniref:Uncharacterized protein n=1 Tax=Vespula squamosa TaxID=30214 RepID=A0ABD2AWI6_VESSQ
MKIFLEASISERMAAYFETFLKSFLSYFKLSIELHTFSIASYIFRVFSGGTLGRGPWAHDRSCLEMSEADGVDGGAFRKRGLTHLQWAEKPEAPEAERHLGTRDLEHDRSCLEMSEADGVDGGAFRKRGLTHLQWAEKPEAPEAERHLGTRDLEVPVSPWVLECSNLLAVGPGSEILALHENHTGSKLDHRETDHRGIRILQRSLRGKSPFFRTRMIGKTLTRVTAGTRVGVSGASLSPTEDCVLIFEISKYRHDRSCLEMSEADGVDGGAFRKRGLTHLQWAEKPEAPEAERHLGTRVWRSPRCFDFLIIVVVVKSRVSVSSWVPICSYLHVVGPGSFH